MEIFKKVERDEDDNIKILEFFYNFKDKLNTN